MFMTKCKIAMKVLVLEALVFGTAGFGMVFFLCSPLAAAHDQEEKDKPRKADKSTWDDVVEGVQARLSPKKVQWTASETPAFEFDLRNQGKKTFHGAVATASCELQVDGKWYKYRGNFPGAPILPLKPGVKSNRWLAVSLGNQWLEEAEAKNKPDREGEPIRLLPGKHTIRIAYRMFPEVRAIRLDKDVPDKEVPDLRVVTNAVEIVITKPAEKNGR